MAIVRRIDGWRQRSLRIVSAGRGPATVIRRHWCGPSVALPKSVQWPSFPTAEESSLRQLLVLLLLFRGELLADAPPHFAEDLLHVRLKDVEVVGDQFLIVADDLIDAGSLIGCQPAPPVHLIDGPPDHLEPAPKRLRSHAYLRSAGFLDQQATRNYARRENDDCGRYHQADSSKVHQEMSPSSAGPRMVCSRSWEKWAA